MCNPAAAIAVAGVVLGAVQSQQTAERQQRYEDLVYKQRMDDALESYAQLQEREFQEREAAAAQIRQLTREARQAVGAAKLQALETGTGGRTLDVLFGQFQADRLAGIGVVERNLAFTTNQLRAQARAALRLTPKQSILGPFDSSLGLATTAVTAYGAGASANAASKPV